MMEDADEVLVKVLSVTEYSLAAFLDVFLSVLVALHRLASEADC